MQRIMSVCVEDRQQSNSVGYGRPLMTLVGRHSLSLNVYLLGRFRIRLAAVVTAGQHKSLVGPFQEVTKGNVVMQQKQMDAIHLAFKNHVQRRETCVVRSGGRSSVLPMSSFFLCFGVL